MKKLIFILTFVFFVGNISASEYTYKSDLISYRDIFSQQSNSLNSQNLEEDNIQKPIAVYCDGVLVGYIYCPSCTTQQLLNAAYAMCN